ncbi:plasmid replication protein, CyRepA1 family [Crocosphaera chwakensis]|uniref:Replication origin-binding protein domain-containing protein n=1 Tax=Crocosphaera chwakensis CCY0110 TaxID=391612 RepID=A3IXJ5_9CHRO|nr:plasmid replication protein, CyRepA1 family [Crocosphaera chwakensis]EAZ88797.1 hypothetical protein CY0110_01050 [Crocosphaera chwakensis CCY0110]
MRNQLTPTTRFNPCPICTDHSGDCRISGDTIILCHGYIDTDSPLSGWKWTKTSSNGVWGVHIVDDGKEFNREQWERDKLLRQQRELDKLNFLGKNALPIGQRDQSYKRLSNYLGLGDRHRKDLQKRGLSDLQIDKIPFFSLDQYSPIPSGIPDNLPGIGTDYYSGNVKFCVSDPGYFCPSFDIKGKINGGQVRYETKNNKYRWLKGVFSSHLPNGELPITLVRGYKGTKGQEKFKDATQTNNPPDSPENELEDPSTDSKVSNPLYLVEGILKPVIASKNLKIDVCGASGGHFKGSPKQFKEIIARYQTLILCPDAGDILNPQVMQRWLNQIEFIKSLELGHSLKILWWGQTIKNSSDIDEIHRERFRKANEISVDHFLEIANLEQYREKTQKAWQTTKHFTPDVTIDQTFINLPCPQDNTILCLKSGLGTGKTTDLIKHLNGYKNENGEWVNGQWFGEGAINLGYRNTLLLQFCEKSGFLHIHHDSRFIDITKPYSRTAACVNSLLRHYTLESFDDKILILDEVVSIIKHLLFSGTIRQRSETIAMFMEAIKRAKTVVCLDGNLSDMYCHFMATCDPSKRLVKVENTYQGNKPELILLEGTINNKGNLRKRDNAPWLNALLNTAKLPVVAADSQILLESIDDLFIAQGRKGIRIDSKTINKKEVKAFLENPVAWIKKHKPQYLLFSPSCESGLDVAITNYFSHFFGFFFGVIDADAITQIIARVRDVDLIRYLWVMPYVKQDNPDSIQSPLVENLQYHLNQRLISDIDSVMSGLADAETLISEIVTQFKASQNTPQHQLAQRIQAMKNYEKSNLRECVYWLLAESGYDISKRVAPLEDAQFKATGKEVSETNKLNKQSNSKDIANASDKYIGQPETLLNYDASWEERCALMKAWIVNTLPGIHEQEIWSPDFVYKIKYEYPNLINQLEDRYLLHNLDKCKERSQRIYHSQLVKGRLGNTLTPWKHNPRYLRLKVLETIGLKDFIHNHYDIEFTPDYEPLQAILKQCRYKKHWLGLGKKPGSNPMRYFKWLLNQIGYSLISRRIKTKEKRDSYVYRICSVPDAKCAYLIDPIMAAIATRYELEKPRLNWDEGRQHILQIENMLQETRVNNVPKIFNHDNAENPPPERIMDGLKPPNTLGEGLRVIAQELDTTNEPDSGKEEHLSAIVSPSNSDKRDQLSDVPEKPNQPQPSEDEGFDWKDIINDMNRHLKRIGWTIEKGREYLNARYGVRSRLKLTDDQLIEFWDFLKMA